MMANEKVHKEISKFVFNQKGMEKAHKELNKFVRKQAKHTGKSEKEIVRMGQVISILARLIKVKVCDNKPTTIQNLKEEMYRHLDGLPKEIVDSQINTVIKEMVKAGFGIVDKDTIVLNEHGLILGYGYLELDDDITDKDKLAFGVAEWLRELSEVGEGIAG